MNFEEGARRFFVVLQWAAFVLTAIAVDLAERPRPVEREIVVPSEMLKRDFSNEPAVLAQLHAPKQLNLMPLSKGQEVISVSIPPTRADWLKHIGLVVLGATVAYALMFAFWKLLQWIGRGFFARR